ncbi:hypothetical protein QQ045_011175 [Rhodiola kirilowii]
MFLFCLNSWLTRIVEKRLACPDDCRILGNLASFSEFCNFVQNSQRGPRRSGEPCHAIPTGPRASKLSSIGYTYLTRQLLLQRRTREKKRETAMDNLSKELFIVFSSHRLVPYSTKRAVIGSCLRLQSKARKKRAEICKLVDKKRGKVVSCILGNSGDRVDSALKDMAVYMKQSDRLDEAIEAIKSFRSLCLPESQESLENASEEGVTFGGKRWKFAKCQGRRIQATVEQETVSWLTKNLGKAVSSSLQYLLQLNATLTPLAFNRKNLWNKCQIISECLVPISELKYLEDLR